MIYTVIEILWWVFAQRNMDVIQDPVYDMEPGIEIFIPKVSPFLGLEFKWHLIPKY